MAYKNAMPSKTIPQKLKRKMVHSQVSKNQEFFTNRPALQEETVWQFLQTFPYDPAIPIPDLYSREIKTYLPMKHVHERS